MAKIATRFVGPTRLTGAAATVLTVASGRKALIRHIHFMNPSGASIGVTVSIGTDGATTRILEAFPIPAGGTYDWYGYVVMDSAEIMQAFAATATVVNMTVFGDELLAG